MLQVRDVMTRDVFTLTPEHTIREAMELLAKQGVSGAPVLSAREVLGVVSSSDLIAFAASLPPVNPPDADLGRTRADFDGLEAFDIPDEEDAVATWFLEAWRDADADVTEPFDDVRNVTWSALDQHTVSEVMTRDVVAMRPSMPLAAAASLMRTKRLHRVLVMEEGRLVGILSTTDIVGAVAEGRLARTRLVFE